VVRNAPSWWVKIGDFSNCKSSLKTQKTLHKSVETSAYQAPEVLGLVVDVEQNQTGEKCDIWSLGCLTFKMLTCHLPFENNRDLEQYCLHTTHDVSNFPYSRLEEVGAREHALRCIQMLLHVSPYQRPTSDEAAKAFKRWIVAVNSLNPVDTTREPDSDIMTEEAETLAPLVAEADVEVGVSAPQERNRRQSSHDTDTCDPSTTSDGRNADSSHFHPPLLASAYEDDPLMVHEIPDPGPSCKDYRLFFIQKDDPLWLRPIFSESTLPEHEIKSRAKCGPVHRPRKKKQDVKWKLEVMSLPRRNVIVGLLHRTNRGDPGAHGWKIVAIDNERPGKTKSTEKVLFFSVTLARNTEESKENL